MRYTEKSLEDVIGCRKHFLKIYNFYLKKTWGMQIV